MGVLLMCRLLFILVLHCWEYMASRILISDAGLTRIIVGFLLAPGFNAHFFLCTRSKRQRGTRFTFATLHDMMMVEN
jgi:hypothetical protein